MRWGGWEAGRQGGWEALRPAGMWLRERRRRAGEAAAAPQQNGQGTRDGPPRPTSPALQARGLVPQALDALTARSPTGARWPRPWTCRSPSGLASPQGTCPDLTAGPCTSADLTSGCHHLATSSPPTGSPSSFTLQPMAQVPRFRFPDFAK